MPRWVKYIEGPWNGRSEVDNEVSANRIRQMQRGGAYVEDPHYGTFTYDGLPARVFVWQPRSSQRQPSPEPPAPINNA